VWADLRPQRAQFGLHEPGALPVGASELDLPRHPASHLVHGTHQHGRRSATVCDERADHGVAVDDRAGHRATYRAVRRAAGHHRRTEHSGHPGAQHGLGVTDRVLSVVVRDVIDRQGPGPVGERHGRGAEQGAQMPDGPLPPVFGQPLAQAGRGKARRVQRVERRAVG
jgi:hypothetical protein